jgi:HK97 family phage major capsid protein
MEGMDDVRAVVDELKGAASVVTELKTQVADLGTKLAAERKEREALELRLNRPRLGGGSGTPDLHAELKAIAAFARTGNEAEMKSMAIGSDPDGGYLVLPAMSETIQRRAFDLSPIARLARQVTIGAGDSWEEVTDLADYEATWTGETEARPETDGSDLSKIRIALDEIYANVRVSQRLLDDSAYDVGGHVTGQIANKFARAQAAAFTTGNGVGRPRGLLDYTTAATADAARDWGTIEHIATGNSGAFAASNPGDTLISTVYRLKAEFRQRAVWMMNSTVAATVRKFKDGEDRYIWQESLAEGQPSRLLGYPVHLSEDMPDLAANSLSVAFGDLSTAYAVVQRPGVKLLRDPYTDKPFVMFYATARVGGGVVNFDAVKLIKAAAS